MNNGPQRILFLTKWYPNSEDPQLGTFVREHAEALAEERAVSLIYAFPDPRLQGKGKPHIDRKRGFTEIIVPYKSKGPKPLRLFRYFKALQRGWKAYLQEDGDPDIIQVHVLNRPACFAYALRKRKGIPFVVTEHWTGFFDGRAQERSCPARMATRYLLRKSQGISAVSRKLGDVLADLSGKDPWIIPNSVADPGPPKEIPKEPFRFLNISDMVDERKNISGLLEAFEQLRQERSETMELHLVGGGPDEEKMRSLAREKGLMDDGDVRFYGRLANDEVQELIPSMSAVVVNSLFETFSVVSVEALAHGRPVAASICGGPEQILEDGKDGRSFQKGDLEATKRAMSELLDKRDRFDPQELHDRILAHYGRKSVREQYLAFYEHCLRKG